MQNDISGADRLVERILKDVEADVLSVTEKFAAEAEAIEAQSRREVEVLASQAKSSRDSAVENILERSRTNAQLDARKYALASKRQLLDSAFEAAYTALSALQGEKRDALLIKTAVGEALGGERICCAETELAGIERLLGEINGALKAQGKPGLTIGETRSNLENGFVLAGNGYEKNCSFLAILSDVRSARETDVYKILFERRED